MNRADVIRPEDVGQECGDGGESSAVHADHHEQAGKEGGPLAAAGDAGNQEKQRDLDHKERDVSVPAADVIGPGCPEESSDQVEDAEQQDERGRFHRSLLENILHDGRRLRQDSDARRDVDKQDGPQQIELRGPQRGIAGDALLVRDLLGRIPAVGLPALRRTPQNARADHHDHEVNGGQRHHGSGDAQRIHEADVQRTGQGRASAESHDGHAGGHAAAVGEPLDQRADGGDVAESAAHSADDAHSQEHQDRLAQREADPADQQPAAE